MAINYAQLKSECQNDPRGYGLVAPYDEGSDQVVADILNTLRDGSNPPVNPTAAGGEADGEIHVKRLAIMADELLEAIDVRDFSATYNANAVPNVVLAGAWLQSALALRSIRLLNDAGNNNVTRGNLNRLLGDAQGSQARLDAIAVKLGSRSEELFGDGTVLQHADIARSRQA